MLRLAICDDMQEFLSDTKNKIEQWEGKPEDLVVELFTDGDGLIESHTANPFDIILLDVVMPLINGIETAAEIRKTDMTVKIVFLTTSSEYALDAFTVHANHYLLKPVDDVKLFECLDMQLKERISNERCINIRDGAVMHRVPLRDIEYMEAQGKKVKFMLSGGSMKESNNPFYHFEEKLLFEDGFFKCHRSYVVNIFKISTYTQTEITMNSGARIPISRGTRAEFESAYFELLFGKGGEIE